MSKFITTLALSLALCSTAAFASEPKTDKKMAKTTSAQPMTANSTGQLQREMTGMHVDMLPETEESTKAVDNPDRIVCKKIERLGSRLKKRKVCATKKEWDQAKTNSVNAVRQMQLTRGRSD